ncbi:protein FAM209-like [Rhynchocyon petersi]
MRTLAGSLFLLLCWTCIHASMFSSLRKKVVEPHSKVPCGEHLRIHQNLSEHPQSWLRSKWLWFFLIVVLYMTLKLRGNGEKKKDQNPTGVRSCSVRSPSRKHQNSSPNKEEFAFNTLTQLEMDLVKLVSKVRNLKVAMTSSSNLQSASLPLDGPNNITIYEIWGDEDSE